MQHTADFVLRPPERGGSEDLTTTLKRYTEYFDIVPTDEKSTTGMQTKTNREINIRSLIHWLGRKPLVNKLSLLHHNDNESLSEPNFLRVKDSLSHSTALRIPPPRPNERTACP